MKRKRNISELSFKLELDFKMMGSGVSMGQEVKKAIGLSQEQMLSFYGPSPDTAAFYPNAGMDDILPKPEDFYRVPFRLISATVVGAKSWKATDFSNTELLKGSMGKLVGKPIYFDHDQDILNWVGVIESTSWEGETTQDGVVIPAGINGILVIDGKTNPKIVRGIAMGAVFSNSVTVKFEWEQSHTFESPNEFYDKLGSYSSTGEMVRRVVVEIKDYHETSLVWLGADPYAKLINKDGKLVNPDYTAAYIPFSKVGEAEKNSYEKDHKMTGAMEMDPSILALSKRKINNNQNFNTMDFKQLLAGMLTMFGWTEADVRTMLGLDAAAEITEEAFKGLLGKSKAEQEAAQSYNGLVGMKVLSLADGKEVEAEFSKETKVVKESFALVTTEKLAAVTSALATAQTEKTNLETQVTELKADADMGKTYLSLKREEVKRLYKTSVGEQFDVAVVALMDKANTTELDGLLKQYVKDRLQVGS